MLKPIFPDNVGIQYVHGFPVGLGAHFPLSPDTELRGGYWIIPFALFMRPGYFRRHPARREALLAWWRERRVS